MLDVSLGVNEETNDAAVKYLEVITAGFGAMVVFRSGVFMKRAGDEDVVVGPSAFLTIFLHALDRRVDRQRAEVRAEAVGRIMKDVSFPKAHAALPVFTLALMQNLSPQEQLSLSRQIQELLTTPGMNDRVKAINLGLVLMSVVGEDVLRKAEETLHEDIMGDEVPPEEESPSNSTAGAGPD